MVEQNNINSFKLKINYKMHFQNWLIIWFLKVICFIYGLFNNAVNSLGYIALNNMINE
jgi:hypothetical protein